MRRSRSKFIAMEVMCPVCDGTGFPPVAQPEQAGRKIYPAPCTRCYGKGRISSLGNAAMTDLAAEPAPRLAAADSSEALDDIADPAPVAVRERDVSTMATGDGSGNS
jgi:hypothetical protein